ncbi:renalase isoform X1 [Xyrichtys novacula]|uniref:Renalase isoform X1 n=1 Tax=Xyrichtys novacula TaxID=13765 RepID=A0AAV1H5S4_XYRNO|nr:renalase isoform X1 [Xyrichtys novacula]
MSRVLIVGAGLTGSLCACLLRRELQNKVQIVVWDKARGAGGRMTTTRPPDSSCSSADLGAQYVTATAAYAQSHHSFYSELLSSGVLQPLDSLIEGLRHKEGNKDYMTPLGMGSLVKHFLSESGADVFFEHHVTGLFLRGASWEVQRKAGDSETFDAVVLTMPVPQILQLQGDMGQSKTDRQTQRQRDVLNQPSVDLSGPSRPGSGFHRGSQQLHSSGSPWSCFGGPDGSNYLNGGQVRTTDQRWTDMKKI